MFIQIVIISCYKQLFEDQTSKIIKFLPITNIIN